MVRKRVLAGLGVLVLAAGVLLARRRDDTALQGIIRVEPGPTALVIGSGTGRALVLKGTYDDGQMGNPGSVQVLDTKHLSILRTAAFPAGLLLAAIDARTGQAAIVNGANTFNSWTGHLSMLAMDNGQLGATVTLGIDPSAVALDTRRGRVFVANNGNRSVSVLDAGTGRVLRTVAVGGNPRAIAVDDRRGRAFVVNYCGSGPSCMTNGTVSLLDSQTGMVLRTIGVGANPTAVALAKRADRAFVLNSGMAESYVSGPRSVTVLDAGSGALVRTTRLSTNANGVAVDNAVIASLAVDDRRGRVFVLGWHGVSVLDARSGQLLRTLPLPLSDPRDIAVDEGSDRVLVLGSDYTTLAGRLWVFDVVTGQLLHTVAIPGKEPRAVVVERQTGQVLVLTPCVAAPPQVDGWRWLPGWLRRRLPFIPPPGTAPANECAFGAVSVFDGARL